MNLKQLRYFAAVAELGSFRKAADTLNVSQPALSLSIKGLEQDLGFQLLDRGPTQVTPTSYGQSLFVRAKQIESDLERALDELSELSGMATGQVTIGFSPYASNREFGRLIGQFMEDYPGIDVRAVTGVYDLFVGDLRNSRIELCVSELRQAVEDRSIVHDLLYDFPYIVVAGAHHPLAGKKRVPLKSLVGYRWLYGTEWTTNISNWRETFDKEGLDPPEPYISGGTSELYEGLLERTDMLAMVPLPVVRPLLERGIIVKLSVPGAKWYSPIAAVYRNDRTLSPAANLLLERIKKNMKDS